MILLFWVIKTHFLWITILVRTHDNRNCTILYREGKSIRIGITWWRDLFGQLRIFIRFRGKLWAEELFFFKGRVRLGLINEISLRCTRAFSTFSKRIPSAQFAPVNSTVFFFRRPHGAINLKIIRSIFHANLSFLPDKNISNTVSLEYLFTQFCRLLLLILTVLTSMIYLMRKNALAGVPSCLFTYTFYLLLNDTDTTKLICHNVHWCSLSFIFFSPEDSAARPPEVRFFISAPISNFSITQSFQYSHSLFIY